MVIYVEAGFYYVGDFDVSRCFRCGLEINKLRHGEDPFAVHERQSPDCLFMKEKLDALMQHLDDCDSDDDELDFDIDSPDDSDLDVFHSEADLRGKPIDKEALRLENIRLKSSITCRKCNNAMVETLFLPCRHLATCDVCGESIADCIECGQKIIGTVQTFLV